MSGLSLAVPEPMGIPLTLQRYMCLYRLPERNVRAQHTIEQYAILHSVGDVGAGQGLVPGGGIAATIGCIAAQGPLVYQPMARDLAKIYQASPDRVTEGIITDAWKIGIMGDIASEFAGQFFAEIDGELAREIGLGGVLGAIPIIGSFVSASIDAVIAATLTWRVDTMISMYYQNGQQWVESRHHTYELTKPMTGWSPNPSARVRLDGIPEQHSTIRDGQLEAVRLLVETLMSVSADKQQIREALVNKGLPEYLVSEAIRRFVN